jgi:RNA methyltransferase, TrmH family
VATTVGSHAHRLRAVRALRTVKGRREQGRFAFEGPTLLADAAAAGFPIVELYATQREYETTPLAAELEASGTPAFIVADTAAAGLSDVATPSGIVAVSPIVLRSLPELLRAPSPILVLADLNDPANAGTLLRSADAFGAGAVVFGRAGVDPYHPKVVRGSMGAIFRLTVGVAEAAELANAAGRAALRVLGLAGTGIPIAQEQWQGRQALVVGHERRGLGRWEALCDCVLSIPMRGPAESLSAAVAGSIALYEASRASAKRALSRESF